MKSVVLKGLTIGLSSVFIVAGCSKQNNVAPSDVPAHSSDNATTVTLPKPDHIVMVILENHAYSQIIGSSSAPYINSLSKSSYAANFTNSYAITHPSQPNYLDIFSGSAQGVTNDNNPPNDPFTTANLAKQLINAGK